MKVLLLVDVQNDFLPGGTLPVKEGHQIIPVINRIQNQYDIILATKDWHPLHHKSFAVEHGKKVGEIIEVSGISQMLWPVHCVQNSYGSEFPKSLNIDRIQKVFYKGTEENIDSYSAFFDKKHLRSTGLDAYLKEKGIDEFTVVGLATDYCVKDTVLDALQLGYKVYVYLEGCRGIGLQENDIKNALDEMARAGAIIKGQ